MKKGEVTVRELTDEEKRILPILKKVSLVLMISSFIFGAAFMFLSLTPVLYRIFSAACILIPAITFGLYIKYNGVLSLEDNKRGSKTFGKARIDITLPLLIPSAVICIRTISDITVTGIGNLLIWSAAVIGVLLFLLFGFTKEYKFKKSAIFVIILSVLIYAPCSVLQINCLYDYSPPTVYSTQLISKEISRSSKGGTHYHITVELNNGNEQQISVSKEYYNAHGEGTDVTVVESNGLLGISNVYAAEDE